MKASWVTLNKLRIAANLASVTAKFLAIFLAYFVSITFTFTKNHLLNINFYDPALQAYKQQLTSTINHNYQEKSHVARTRPFELVPAAIKEQAQLATASATELLQSENDQIHVSPSAHSAAIEWGMAWVKSKHKEIVEPRPGEGQVPYRVIHIESDGIWLDLGRTRAFYQTSDTNGISVGSKVTVGKNMEILLLQKILETGKER